MGFSLTITESKESKDANYQDAFMRVNCDCCDNVLGPVFEIQATYKSPLREYYGGTTLLHAHTTAEGIAGACAQAVELYRVMAPMIDAAESDWNQREADRIAQEEADALKAEEALDDGPPSDYSDLVGDEAES